MCSLQEECCVILAGEEPLRQSRHPGSIWLGVHLIFLTVETSTAAQPNTIGQDKKIGKVTVAFSLGWAWLWFGDFVPWHFL
jgi:hypothetical protein